MCFAVLRISYRNGTEPTILKEVATEGEFTKTLEELTNRDGVRKVTTFFPHMSRELVSEWKDTYHEKSNKNPLASAEPLSWTKVIPPQLG